jgi:DNA-binding IscR family transcriptional regulator
VCAAVAARLVLAAAAAAQRGEAPPTRDDLVRRFDLPFEAVERMLRKLCERGVLKKLPGDPPGYAIARPPAEISLYDVVVPFRGRDVLMPGARAASIAPLDVTFERLDGHADAELRATKLDSLLRPPS